MRAAAALKAPGARQVLAALRRPQPATFADVHRTTGLAISSVQHHVQRLVAAGLVLREAGRGAARLRLTEAGIAAGRGGPADAM